VLSVGPDGIGVACGDGTRLLLLEVQPESRRAMAATAWAAGARLRPGARLG
jgi:methionyl-tRNA formyltransferase